MVPQNIKYIGFSEDKNFLTGIIWFEFMHVWPILIILQTTEITYLRDLPAFRRVPMNSKTRFSPRECQDGCGPGMVPSEPG
jgi:hypothetical protein